MVQDSLITNRIARDVFMTEQLSPKPVISADTLQRILEFRDERNWKQFHNPKDLAISLSLEAAELLECFQWSGKDTEVRPGAFIRGNAIVGEKCVVGNSTELKNVILFNNVQVPHYNYVGDSILGYKSHMGAGSITSNVKSDKTNVVIKYEGDKIETGLKKMGAILGNYVEVGCNSVLNPGTIIGSNTNIYPLSSVRGYVPKGSIYKKQGDIVEKR
jgi:NDP-sugar pyrophosphorylase family protein